MVKDLPSGSVTVRTRAFQSDVPLIFARIGASTASCPNKTVGCIWPLRVASITTLALPVWLGPTAAFKVTGKAFCKPDKFCAVKPWRSNVILPSRAFKLRRQSGLSKLDWRKVATPSTLRSPKSARSGKLTTSVTAALPSALKPLKWLPKSRPIGLARNSANNAAAFRPPLI